MSSSFATIKAALGLAALLGGLGLSWNVDAQESKLPACPTDQSVDNWHNCFGTKKLFTPSQLGFKDIEYGLYVGEFKEGKFNGRGFLKGSFAEIYVGEFKAGKKHGQGTQTLAGVEKYVGEFKDGKRSGHGSLYESVWSSYLGDFKDDKKHGQGTQTWSNGEKYVGEFKNGKRDGKGIKYSEIGSVLQMGIWVSDDFAWEANVTLRAPPTAPPSPPIAATPEPRPQGSPAPPPLTASKSSSGTAFRIANSQFMTNHHVINGCTSIKVEGKLGGRVIASDAIKDLALVSVAKDSGPIASIRTTRIQLNESITVAGFPLEGAFSGIAITNGTISRLSGLRGDTDEVQISAPVQPGNSGGPLLDTAGNVIGVVSSKLNALKVAGTSGDIPQNVNFAINGSSLRAFLGAKNVNYKEVGNERELTGVQIAARASAFTVLIECQR